MREFPSTEAKDNWGLITDAALREPVAITKHGRPSLVVMGVRDYKNLLRLKYDHLKADIQEGIGQLTRGEGRKLKGDAVLSEFFEDIKTQGQARLKKASRKRA